MLRFCQGPTGSGREGTPVVNQTLFPCSLGQEPSGARLLFMAGAQIKRHARTENTKTSMTKKSNKGPGGS